MGDRTKALGQQVREASEALVRAVQQVPEAEWTKIPEEGVWSPGKDAEHVTETVAFHQNLVRSTIEAHAPTLDGAPTVREVMVAELSREEIIARLRQTGEASATLVEGLADEALEMQAPPRRSTNAPRTLGELIAGQMIHHYDEHRTNIEEKFR